MSKRRRQDRETQKTARGDANTAAGTDRDAGWGQRGGSRWRRNVGGRPKARGRGRQPTERPEPVPEAGPSAHTGTGVRGRQPAQTPEPVPEAGPSAQTGTGVRGRQPSQTAETEPVAGPSAQDSNSAEDAVPFEGNDFSVAFRRERGVRLLEERVFGERAVVERIYNIDLNWRFRDRLLVDALDDLRRIFQDILDHAREVSGPSDLGRLFVQSPEDLYSPIQIGPLPLRDLSVEELMMRIEAVTQSDRTIRLNNTFQIHLGICSIPNGGVIRQFYGEGNDRISSHGIGYVKSDDVMCLARSLIICRAFEARERLKRQEGYPPEQLEHAERELIKVRKQNRFPEHRYALARELHLGAGLQEDEPASLDDIYRFEAILGTRIVVISAALGCKVVYSGSIETEELYLVLFTRPEEEDVLAGNSEGHFDAVLTPSCLYTHSNFCLRCLQPYRTPQSHLCEGLCRLCLRMGCTEDGSVERGSRCNDCNRVYRSQTCYMIHRRKRTVGRGKRRQQVESQCRRYIQCLTCMKLERRDEFDAHKCWHWTCRICDQLVEGGHLCYMRAKMPNSVDPRFMTCDFECDPNGVHKPNALVAQWKCRECANVSFRDNPYCSWCGLRCEGCQSEEVEAGTPPCCRRLPACGIRRKEFRGMNTARDFCLWVFRDEWSGYTLRFHNGGAYDVYFLLPYLFDNVLDPDCIFRGSRVMYARVGKGLNIRIVDTLNHIPMSLAKMAQAFHLPESKGHFPHFFNTVENAGYVGPIPDREYFGVESMSVEGRKEFDRWYDEFEASGKVYDLETELSKYCRADVTLLEEACDIYARNMVELTSKEVITGVSPEGEPVRETVAVHPFHYVTAASVTMAIFRWMFLEERFLVELADGRLVIGLEKFNTLKLYDDFNNEIEEDVDIVNKTFVSTPIAHIPAGGFAGRDNFSKDSILWLKWVEHCQGVTIQHALTPEGEYRVRGPRGGTVKLDGYRVDAQGRRYAYFYNGCVWHGHTCIVQGREDVRLLEEALGSGSGQTFNQNAPWKKWKGVYHPHTGQSMSELYRKWNEQLVHLRQEGFTVITMWECDWRREKERDEVRAFCQGETVMDRLDDRACLYGGRVSATRLYYEVPVGETMQYYDFNSLYPSVLKYCRYPVGFPEVILKDFEPLENYFGLVKCTVLPPFKLFHAVLPYRVGDRLFFPLCADCAENLRDGPCQCALEKRYILGQWVTPEVELAVEHGYKVVQVYEVWHWSETACYNTDTGESGLFGGFIDLLMKLKTEATGYPSWCDSDEKRHKFIADFEEHEHVKLDPTKMRPNPGARMLAKIALNSFWGKMAQRDNLPARRTVRTMEEYMDMVSNPSFHLKDFHVMHKTALQITYTRHKDFVAEKDFTNIWVAAFTTAHGRIRLFRVIHALGKDALYFDTDSVICIMRPLTPASIPIGDYLGQLKSELRPGESIEIWVSSGAKSYAYREKESGNSVTKLKGFTLDCTASTLINFQAMVDIVRNHVHPEHYPLENPALEIRDGTVGVNVIYHARIRRHLDDLRVFSRDESKFYRVVFTKRWVVKDGSFLTYPHGYNIERDLPET